MKRIIIVGASSGLGERIATDFASAGYSVGICARRDEPLKALRDRFPNNIVYETLDVTASDAVERFRRLIDLLGGLDTLLYAAGCGWNNPQLDPEFDMRTVRTNVDGFTAIVHDAFAYFRDNGLSGQIAAITSIAGTRGLSVSATYSASKRYQWNLLEALDQLARQQHLDIAITDIRPGFIDTPLLATATRRYPMLMTIDRVAPLIERAILRRRRIVTVDWRWRILGLLWRRIPRFIWRRIKL